jgi:hypothetical protein
MRQTNRLSRGFCGFLLLMVLPASAGSAPLPSVAAPAAGDCVQPVVGEDVAATISLGTAVPPGDPPAAFRDSSDEELSVLERTFGLIGRTFETTLRHEDLSRSIEAMSQRLDSFFGAEQFYEENTATDSYAAVKFSSVYERGGDLSFDPRFRLRIDLPRTERRLKIRFELEDEDYDVEELGIRGSDETTSGDKDLNASLKFLFQETHKWSFSLAPGLRIKVPLDPFLKLRVRRGFDLFRWRARFVQVFEWFDSSGYGSRSTFFLDRRLDATSLLRLTSEAYRNEEDYAHNDFEVSQSLLLFRALKPRLGLSTEVGVVGYTEPSWSHDRYFYNVRLRRDIHKGFVFFEIKPQVDFHKEDNFRGDPSLTLTLEVLYGADYYGL